MQVQSLVSGSELMSWRKQAQKAAIAAEINPSEVDWLLQEVSSLDRLALRLESFARRSEIPLEMPLSDLHQLWQRRLSERVPVQYLVGQTPWRRFSLQVSPSVLIPRPETEYIIDLALQAVQEIEELTLGHWVDLGTGSGAIALGLADIFPQAQIHAVDESADALKIAQENAVNLGFAERIQFYSGSWWQPLHALQGKVSGMISNPPYIPSSLVLELQPEVTNHEPHLALDGGEDGLDSIRHLVETSPLYLRPGGVWLIEMMAGQAQTVTQLLRQQGSYTNIQVFRDFAGIERFALAYKKL